MVFLFLQETQILPITMPHSIQYLMRNSSILVGYIFNFLVRGNLPINRLPTRPIRLPWCIAPVLQLGHVILSMVILIYGLAMSWCFSAVFICMDNKQHSNCQRTRCFYYSLIQEVILGKGAWELQESFAFEGAFREFWRWVGNSEDGYYIIWSGMVWENACVFTATQLYNIDWHWVWYKKILHELEKPTRAIFF